MPTPEITDTPPELSASAPRAVMRRIHGRLLRLGLVLLTAGIFASLILPLQPSGFLRQHPWLHTTLTSIAVLLSSAGLLMTANHWFGLRSTDTSEAFEKHRLPGRYRRIAWLLVLAALILAAAAFWYTTSRGLSQW